MDAFRFTLANQIITGMELSLLINITKGFKAFINKIWNASRFVFIHLKGNENLNINFRRIKETPPTGQSDKPIRIAVRRGNPKGFQQVLR